MTTKDLQKIKGIKRRTARKIRKELDSMQPSKPTPPIKEPEPVTEEFQTVDDESEEIIAEWDTFDTEDPEPPSEPSLAYTHGEYTLYKKQIPIKNGSTRTVHFFSKKVPDTGKPAALPEGYTVKINKKTGLPYIKKKP